MDWSEVFKRIAKESCAAVEAKVYHKAKANWELAAKIKPKSPYAWLGLSTSYARLYQYEEALEFAKKAVELTKGQHARSLHELGKIYFWLFDFENAKSCLRKAHELFRKKDSSAIHLTSVDAAYYAIYVEVDIVISNLREMKLLGFDPFDMTQTEDVAKEHLKPVKASHERYAATFSALANCAFNLKKTRLTEHFCKLAVAFSCVPSTLNNLSIFYYHTNQTEKSAEIIDKFRWNEEDTIESNKAFVYLRSHRFTEGWKVYETRSFKKILQEMMPTINFEDKWDGEVKEGKRIHFISEQGYGDNIQFSRFIKQLKKKKGASFCLYCYQPLVELFSYNFPEVEVRLFDDIPCDFKDKIPNNFLIGSFPLLFNTTNTWQ